jgi:TPR repeat protein
VKAVEYLKRACGANHAPSCFNLAVLFNKGDLGVPRDEQLFLHYKQLTTKLVGLYGGINSTRVA